MTQLKWRIDVLKNFGRNEDEKSRLNIKTSLTGKVQEDSNKDMTFDEMYEMQKRKFNALKERRKTKLGDSKYLDMVGNMQLRKEKKKNLSKTKVEDQMRMLNDRIDEKTV